MYILKGVFTKFGMCLCGKHQALYYPYRTYDKIYDCKTKKWVNNNTIQKLINEEKIKNRNKIIDIIMNSI